MSNEVKQDKAQSDQSSASTPVQPQREKETSLSHESQLVSFGERVTYTFVHGREVGSIHFDRMRGEVFYKGHNIRHMELEEVQMQMLEKLRSVLLTDQRTKRFAESYARILDKIIIEKSQAQRPSP